MTGSEKTARLERLTGLAERIRRTIGDLERRLGDHREARRAFLRGALMVMASSNECGLGAGRPFPSHDDGAGEVAAAIRAFFHRTWIFVGFDADPSMVALLMGECAWLRDIPPEDFINAVSVHLGRRIPDFERLDALASIAASLHAKGHPVGVAPAATGDLLLRTIDRLAEHFDGDVRMAFCRAAGAVDYDEFAVDAARLAVWLWCSGTPDMFVMIERRINWSPQSTMFDTLLEIFAYRGRAVDVATLGDDEQSSEIWTEGTLPNKGDLLLKIMDRPFVVSVTQDFRR